MTPEQAKALREPFPPEAVGKLPRVWCGQCRELTKSNRRPSACQSHGIAKCQVCGNKMTDAHLHLDYVGHAETTDRLLAVDPQWTWEPVAFNEQGLPVLDQRGGLWIRLTVAGVTRLGYGHAGEKTGPDAVKEAIGDCIRNAAMRFGVALDLWGAKFKDEEHHSDPAVTETASEFPQPPAELGTDSPPGEVRARIKTAGEAKSLTVAEIAEDFFEWSKGEQIGTADTTVLLEYLNHLTPKEPA